MAELDKPFPCTLYVRNRLVQKRPFLLFSYCKEGMASLQLKHILEKHSMLYMI